MRKGMDNLLFWPCSRVCFGFVSVAVFFSIPVGYLSKVMPFALCSQVIVLVGQMTVWSCMECCGAVGNCV